MYSYGRFGDCQAKRVRDWVAPGNSARRDCANTRRHLLPAAPNGENLECHESGADPALKHYLRKVGIKSMIVCPLLADDEQWGEIEFGDALAERNWSPGDIHLLKAMAEMTGIAIGRDRALRELADADQIIENSPVILYRIEAQPPHALTYVSRNVVHYGYRTDDLLAKPTDYFDLVHADDRVGLLLDISQIVSGRKSQAGHDRRMRRADGRYMWFQDHMRGLFGEIGTLDAIEGILIDIDDRKEAEAQLRSITLGDALTGLANRRSFMERLGQAFEAAKQGGQGFAIHYIDLDRFQDVNDVHGHSFGDELLRLVARKLLSRGRKSDVVARFGGDEFAILQNDVKDAAEASQFADRILGDVSGAYALTPPVEITASIGISVFSAELTDPVEMIKQADVALYRAKELGRNQYHFHSHDLDAAIVERVTLGSDLRKALEHREFELLYQPQVEAASGKLTGLEALLRWHHPREGFVSPNRFIKIAEQTGTIIPIGQWVFEEVCRQIKEWRQAGFKVPPVSLNVSAVQLKSDPEFTQRLMTALASYGLEADAIELELTESVLMETAGAHGEAIEHLRRAGVPIALDDFGTGYSSLGYLRAYPVNHIKIAQEFISNIRPGSEDLAIVRATIGLAKELGIKLIAEGVESKFQHQLLMELGCPTIQGFYFSTPLTVGQTEALLERGYAVPPVTDAGDVPQPVTPEGKVSHG